MTTRLKAPDREACKRIGKSVRQRLEGDPGIYKLPTDQAEIFAVGDFLSAAECQRFVDLIDKVARPSELHESAYVEKFRTSYSGNFDREDPFVRSISRRIDDLLGIEHPYYPLPPSASPAARMQLLPARISSGKVCTDILRDHSS